MSVARFDRAAGSCTQMNQKKVAVITSSWNRAKYLPRFFSAIQKLDLSDLELVWFFAYGPSGDDTLTMLKQAQLPFKSHIVTKKDVGSANGDSAYSGIAEAQNCVRKFIDNTYGRGHFDFISYIDADVLIPPNFFTRLIPYFENPHYAAIFGWGTVENSFVNKMDRVRVRADHRETWESGICGGGSTIYREELFGDHDEKFIRRSDTDFILSITRGKRDYYKTLYVNVGMVHLHEMDAWEALTKHAYVRGYYWALLWLKHRDFYGNPYLERANLLYFGIILDSPLFLLFLAGIVPWWLGIWSIVGMAVGVSWAAIRIRKGVNETVIFALYDTTRELVTHVGLLFGLASFDIWATLKAGLGKLGIK